MRPIVLLTLALAAAGMELIAKNNQFKQAPDGTTSGHTALTVACTVGESMTLFDVLLSANHTPTNSTRDIIVECGNITHSWHTPVVTQTYRKTGRVFVTSDSIMDSPVVRAERRVNEDAQSYSFEDSLAGVEGQTRRRRGITQFNRDEVHYGCKVCCDVFGGNTKGTNAETKGYDETYNLPLACPNACSRRKIADHQGLAWDSVKDDPGFQQQVDGWRTCCAAGRAKKNGVELKQCPAPSGGSSCTVKSPGQTSRVACEVEILNIIKDVATITRGINDNTALLNQRIDGTTEMIAGLSNDLGDLIGIVGSANDNIGRLQATTGDIVAQLDENERVLNRNLDAIETSFLAEANARMASAVALDDRITQLGGALGTALDVKETTIYANMFRLGSQLQNDMVRSDAVASLQLSSSVSQLLELIQENNQGQQQLRAFTESLVESVRSVYDALLELTQEVMAVGNATLTYHSSLRYIRDTLGMQPFVDDAGSPPFNLSRANFIGSRDYNFSRYQFSAHPIYEDCSDNAALGMDTIYQNRPLAEVTIPITNDLSYAHVGERLELHSAAGGRLGTNCPAMGPDYCVDEIAALQMIIRFVDSAPVLVNAALFSGDRVWLENADQETPVPLAGQAEFAPEYENKTADGKFAALAIGLVFRLRTASGGYLAIAAGGEVVLGNASVAAWWEWRRPAGSRRRSDPGALASAKPVALTSAEVGALVSGPAQRRRTAELTEAQAEQLVSDASGGGGCANGWNVRGFDDPDWSVYKATEWTAGELASLVRSSPYDGLCPLHLCDLVDVTIPKRPYFRVAIPDESWWVPVDDPVGRRSCAGRTEDVVKASADAWGDWREIEGDAFYDVGFTPALTNISNGQYTLPLRKETYGCGPIGCAYGANRPTDLTVVVIAPRDTVVRTRFRDYWGQKYNSPWNFADCKGPTGLEAGDFHLCRQTVLPFNVEVYMQNNLLVDPPTPHKAQCINKAWPATDGSLTTVFYVNQYSDALSAAYPGLDLGNVMPFWTTTQVGEPANVKYWKQDQWVDWTDPFVATTRQALCNRFSNPPGIWITKNVGGFKRESVEPFTPIWQPDVAIGSVFPGCTELAYANGELTGDRHPRRREECETLQLSGACYWEVTSRDFEAGECKDPEVGDVCFNRTSVAECIAPDQGAPFCAWDKAVADCVPFKTSMLDQPPADQHFRYHLPCHLRGLTETGCISVRTEPEGLLQISAAVTEDYCYLEEAPAPACRSTLQAIYNSTADFLAANGAAYAGGQLADPMGEAVYDAWARGVARCHFFDVNCRFTNNADFASRAPRIPDPRNSMRAADGGGGCSVHLGSAVGCETKSGGECEPFLFNGAAACTRRCDTWQALAECVLGDGFDTKCVWQPALEDAGDPQFNATVGACVNGQGTSESPTSVSLTNICRLGEWRAPAEDRCMPVELLNSTAQRDVELQVVVARACVELNEQGPNGTTLRELCVARSEAALYEPLFPATEHPCLNTSLATCDVVTSDIEAIQQGLRQQCRFPADEIGAEGFEYTCLSQTDARLAGRAELDPGCVYVELVRVAGQQLCLSPLDPFIGELRVRYPEFIIFKQGVPSNRQTETSYRGLTMATLSQEYLVDGAGNPLAAETLGTDPRLVTSPRNASVFFPCDRVVNYTNAAGETVLATFVNVDDRCCHPDAVRTRFLDSRRSDAPILYRVCVDDDALPHSYFNENHPLRAYYAVGEAQCDAVYDSRIQFNDYSQLYGVPPPPGQVNETLRVMYFCGAEAALRVSALDREGAEAWSAAQSRAQGGAADAGDGVVFFNETLAALFFNDTDNATTAETSSEELFVQRNATVDPNATAATCSFPGIGQPLTGGVVCLPTIFVVDYVRLGIGKRTERPPCFLPVEIAGVERLVVLLREEDLRAVSPSREYAIYSPDTPVTVHDMTNISTRLTDFSREEHPLESTGLVRDIFLSYFQRDFRVLSEVLTSMYGPNVATWLATRGDFVKTNTERMISAADRRLTHRITTDFGYFDARKIPVRRMSEPRTRCTSRLAWSTGGAYADAPLVSCVGSDDHLQELPPTDTPFIFAFDELSASIVSPPFASVVVDGSYKAREGSTTCYHTFGADDLSPRDFVTRNPDYTPACFADSPLRYASPVGGGGELDVCGQGAGADGALVSEQNLVFIRLGLVVLEQGFAVPFLNDRNETSREFWAGVIAGQLPAQAQTASWDSVIAEFLQALDAHWRGEGRCVNEFANFLLPAETWVEDTARDAAGVEVPVIRTQDVAQVVWRNCSAIPCPAEDIAHVLQPYIDARNMAQCGNCPADECAGELYVIPQDPSNSAFHGVCRLGRFYTIEGPTEDDYLALSVKSGGGSIQATFHIDSAWGDLVERRADESLCPRIADEGLQCNGISTQCIVNVENPDPVYGMRFRVIVSVLRDNATVFNDAQSYSLAAGQQMTVPVSLRAAATTRILLTSFNASTVCLSELRSVNATDEFVDFTNSSFFLSIVDSATTSNLANAIAAATLQLTSDVTFLLDSLAPVTQGTWIDTYSTLEAYVGRPVVLPDSSFFSELVRNSNYTVNNLPATEALEGGFLVIGDQIRDQIDSTDQVRNDLLQLEQDRQTDLATFLQEQQALSDQFNENKAAIDAALDALDDRIQNALNSLEIETGGAGGAGGSGSASKKLSAAEIGLIVAVSFTFCTQAAFFGWFFYDYGTRNGWFLSDKQSFLKRRNARQKQASRSTPTPTNPEPETERLLEDENPTITELLYKLA